MPLIFASNIDSILANPSQGFVVLVLIVGVVLFSLVCVIGGLWYNFRQAERDASLKREMLERGMSADEIERVLAAKTGADPANLV